MQERRADFSHANLPIERWKVHWLHTAAFGLFCTLLHTHRGKWGWQQWKGPATLHPGNRPMFWIIDLVQLWEDNRQRAVRRPGWCVRSEFHNDQHGTSGDGRARGQQPKVPVGKIKPRCVIQRARVVIIDAVSRIMLVWLVDIAFISFQSNSFERKKRTDNRCSNTFLQPFIV